MTMHLFITCVWVCTQLTVRSFVSSCILPEDRNTNQAISGEWFAATYYLTNPSKAPKQRMINIDELLSLVERG